MRTNEEIMAELVKRRENCEKERGIFMKRAIKTTSLFLIFALVMGIVGILNINAASVEWASMTDMKIELVKEGKTLFDTAMFINYEENMHFDELQDGVTVIYGYDIDVDAVEKQLLGLDRSSLKAEKTKNLTDLTEYGYDSPVDSDGNLVQGYNEEFAKEHPAEEYKDIRVIAGKEQLAENIVESNEIVYIIIFNKVGDRVDRDYICVDYDVGVDMSAIETFINYDLSDVAVKNYTKQFINNQIANETSAFNAARSEESAPISSEVSKLVDSARKFPHFIGKIKLNGNEYPLMIYKATCEYYTFLEANDLTKGDPYQLITRMTVTPGNMIPSSEHDGIYNDRYKNQIVILGARNQLINIYPDGDDVNNIQPALTDSDVNGRYFPINSVTGKNYGFDLDCDTSGKVSMTYSSNHNGTSFVEIEGYSTTLTKSVLSTSTFILGTEGGILSENVILNTKFGSQVKYYFQSYGEDSAIWAGSEYEVYYVNN